MHLSPRLVPLCLQFGNIFVVIILYLVDLIENFISFVCLNFNLLQKILVLNEKIIKLLFVVLVRNELWDCEKGMFGAGACISDASVVTLVLLKLYSLFLRCLSEVFLNLFYQIEEIVFAKKIKITLTDATFAQEFLLLLIEVKVAKSHFLKLELGYFLQESFLLGR